MCRAPTAQAALDALWPEMRLLEQAPLDAPATTLFALPGALAADWHDYMALHERAEREGRSVSGAPQLRASHLLRRASADPSCAAEAVQLVPFHPDALYSETERDAAEFATRSPLPIIHLLRYADIRRAEAEWEGGDIASANADRLRGLGVAALAGMLGRFRRALLDGS